ncbi:unnamed protein product [Calypogeia fissa]
MGADIRTTVAAQGGYRWKERKAFTTAVAASSDDDDNFELGEVSDPAIKSSATGRGMIHSYEVVDSDDDSLFSETSLETGLIRTSTIITGSTQDTSSEDDDDDDSRHGSLEGKSAARFRTVENPMYETRVGSFGNRKRSVANLAAQDEDDHGDMTPLNDECDDEGNFSNHVVDERSRLMAAACAAAIPSENDSFSDDSNGDEISRLMAAAQAAAIPSNDSFSDDSNHGDKRSRLTAAAQTAAIPSNDSFSDDSAVDERSRIMAAAQAATIASENDSFSDESAVSASPKDRSISKMTKLKWQTSTKVAPTVAKAINHDSEDDLESAECFSFTDAGSDSGYSTDHDVARRVTNIHVQKKTTRVGAQNVRGYRDRRFSTNSVEAEAGDQGDFDDGTSIGSELSESYVTAKGNSDHGRKPQKLDGNSASFSATSTTSFKWSNVKSKIFYSFRALKAGAASTSNDGSRTISVRNLAKGVTDERLHDFFQDAGTILDIWIVKDAQSGLSSAYVEFDSGTAARKAAQKSGKKLEGRVIFCDTAYENSNSRGGDHSRDRSAPSSGHGGARTRARAKSDQMSSESDSASINSRVAETQAALQMFDPELREGDAKFLSRFSDQNNVRSPYGDNVRPSSRGNVAESGGSAHSGRSRLNTSGHGGGGNPREGSTKGKGILPWAESYEAAILQSGKNQAELGESVYYDAQNLESSAQCTSLIGHKLNEEFRRRKGKLSRSLWSWKWTQLQLGQLGGNSPSWVRRPSCGCIDTDEKKIVMPVSRHNWR